MILLVFCENKSLLELGYGTVLILICELTSWLVYQLNLENF